jgi:hypothetical protein
LKNKHGLLHRVLGPVKPLKKRDRDGTRNTYYTPL